MEDTDNRTLKQLAQESIDVQNAVNLASLLGAWYRAARRLRALGLDNQANDNEPLYPHPIHRMWISKIASLCGTQEVEEWFGAAYDAVMKMAEGE